MSLSASALPGEDWLEIIRRPTQRAFASAFTGNVTLVTSVASIPIVGPVGVRHFLDAIRLMYDPVAFMRETTAGSRTCLEWQGIFELRDVAGVTVLCRNAEGLIEGIQLYYRPYEQVVACSAELARRLAGKLVPLPFRGR